MTPKFPFFGVSGFDLAQKTAPDLGNVMSVTRNWVIWWFFVQRLPQSPRSLPCRGSGEGSQPSPNDQPLPQAAAKHDGQVENPDVEIMNEQFRGQHRIGKHKESGARRSSSISGALQFRHHQEQQGETNDGNRHSPAMLQDNEQHNGKRWNIEQCPLRCVSYAQNNPPPKSAM